MSCSSTMTHMCSWSGGCKKCHRCKDNYCNYHLEINNGGASGGHVCCCQEGAKNAATWHMCGDSGSFEHCQDCNQFLCYYHLPPNNGGSVGGHNGCKRGAKKCAVVVGGLTCGGRVAQCPDCEHYFCRNHKKPGIKHGVDGHGCDIGCATTTHTKVNCSGKKSQLIKCKLCEKVGNDYSYCAYHAMPVAHLLSIGAEEGGGHVCQGYTTGSMLFGDNAGDFFMLACDMAVTVATAGSVNPSAATFAGNAMKVTIHEIIEALGFDVLLSLRPKVNEFIKKLADKQRDKEMKKLPKSEPLDTKDAQELQKTLKQVAQALEKFNKGLASTFSKFGASVQNQTDQIDGIINALNKICKVVKLGGDLKAFVEKLTASLKKPVNPVKVIDAVREAKGLTDSIVNECS